MNLAKQALTASLENTLSRLQQQQQRAEVEELRGTNVVAFQGFDSDKGKHFGTKEDGSVVYFDLETNASLEIGQNIEVALPVYSQYGRGDALPITRGF